MSIRPLKPQHETRTRILDAAEELFMQHGFEGTSMRHLTSRAGVNLAACCLDLAVGRALPALRFSEIAVARYFEEVVLIGQDRRRRRPGRAVRRGERQTIRTLGTGCERA